MIKPEEVGISSQQLTLIEKHLMDRYIAPGKIAGALTLIARRGKIAYFSPLGMMDIERNRVMAQDTIFRIYSMTKPITSVVMMMLYEQGYFQLNDPVSKFIPEWRDLRVYVSGNHPTFLTKPTDRDMTIRDLFTHTSGLTYGLRPRTNLEAAYQKLQVGEIGAEITLREMVEKLASLPLEFSPGEAWNYSVSTDVLGYLVQVISGLSFDDYLQTKIFEPLGMVDTGFYVPEEKLERFAANYTRTNDKKRILMDDPEKSRFAKPPKFLSGGGGLVSTATDYLHFCQMLLNGGELDGARILGRKTIELMTRNHLPDGRDMGDMSVSSFNQVDPEGSGFGLGFSIILDPVRAGVIGSAEEYSWGGAASTAFWIDPAEELIVIFLTQFMPVDTFNFRNQLKALIYPALLD